MTLQQQQKQKNPELEKFELEKIRQQQMANQSDFLANKKVYAQQG